MQDQKNESETIDIDTNWTPIGEPYEDMIISMNMKNGVRYFSVNGSFIGTFPQGDLERKLEIAIEALQYCSDKFMSKKAKEALDKIKGE